MRRYSPTRVVLTYVSCLLFDIIWKKTFMIANSFILLVIGLGVVLLCFGFFCVFSWIDPGLNKENLSLLKIVTREWNYLKNKKIL